MADEDEFQNEPAVPQVDVTLETPEVFRHVLVVPASMSVLLQALPKTSVGSIDVTYAESEVAENEEEFDDDEQLYSAANLDAIRRKYPAASIPLYAVTDVPVLAVSVPHFANPIAEKRVAGVIATLAPNATVWVALAPCQLNNGTTIGKFDLSSTLFGTVQPLQPPHFATGISAALISVLSSQNKLDNVGSLALNAEGHPGFEKVDADAIMDAAREVYATFFDLAKASEAVQKLSGIVRKINSASTSGMYL